MNFRELIYSIKEAIKDKFDIALSSISRVRAYEQTFEDGTTDTSVSNATQTVQTSEVYGGTYALRVTIASGQTGYVETPTRPVSPNQRMTFSFAHKEDANITDVKLIVVWYRANMQIISTEEYTLTPSDSWKVDGRTVTAPQNATYMALRMQATAGASDGNIYLDDITMDLVGQIFRVDGAGQVKVTDTDLQDALLTQLDAKLSTRASESTLSSVDSKVGTQESFSHGQVTVGTSAVQLPSASAVKGVLVKAHKDNSGTIYVGNSSGVTTSNGFELGAGEAVVIEVDNANKIWLIADADGQEVSWIAV